MLIAKMEYKVRNFRFPLKQKKPLISGFFVFMCYTFPLILHTPY